MNYGGGTDELSANMIMIIKMRNVVTIIIYTMKNIFSCINAIKIVQKLYTSSRKGSENSFILKTHTFTVSLIQNFNKKTEFVRNDVSPIWGPGGPR